VVSSGACMPIGVNMRNSFEVEMLDKGMNITVYEDKGEDIYETPQKIAESDKEKIKAHFNRWIDGTGKNFSFTESEG